MSERHALTANRIPAERVRAYGLDGEPGTFTPSGRWIEDAERTEAYACVRYLCGLRKRGAVPSEIAAVVTASRFPDILGGAREFWAKLPHSACWPLALSHGATSAGVTIARMRSEMPNSVIPPGCSCLWCSLNEGPRQDAKEPTASPIGVQDVPEASDDPVRPSGGLFGDLTSSDQEDDPWKV